MNFNTTLIPTFNPPHPRSFKRITEQDRIHQLIITKSAPNTQPFTKFDMLTPQPKSYNNDENESNKSMNNNASSQNSINNTNNNLLDGFDLFDGDIMYQTTSNVDKNSVNNISNNNNNDNIDQLNSISSHKSTNQGLSYHEPTYHTSKQPINESNSPTPLFPTLLTRTHTTINPKQSSLVTRKDSQQQHQQASLSDLMNKHTTTTNNSTTSMLSKSTTIHRKNMLSPTSSSTSHSHKSPVKGKASRSGGGPITPPRPSFSSSDFDGLKSFSR